MEFTVNRSDLVRELSLSQGVVEKKTTIPILSNFLFEAAGDRLSLTATDLDLSLRTGCPAKVKKDGACTIPARRLFDYVKLLPEGDITIRLLENHWVNIRSGRSNTKMVGMARSNFPSLPAFPAGTSYKLPSQVLHRMIAEDPTLVVEHDATTNETVLRALGDLHLRSVLERMASQFKLEVDTRPPRSPYRETITGKAEGFHRHKKQTGGAGLFGEVFLRIEPLPRGAGFEFVDHVKGGTIPNQFIPAVQKGVEQVLTAGPVAGFPLQDVRVIVYDGKHHPVDSKEIAFVTAGRKAFLDAIEKARPIVLEPIVNVEVLCPESTMGDVAGDLSGRRGQVTGTKSLQPGTLTVDGQAPLSELDGYAARLKAMTAGHAAWTMALSHYDPAPPNLQQQLAAEYAKHRRHEED